MLIKNYNKLPVIDYRLVKPLQGNLKDLSKANYAKLKSVLDKRGFEVPLFLWKSGEDFYLMDGHQRQRVMVKEDMHDNGNYAVPYVLIDAANEKEAKAKLLEITSQYGTITQEGFDEFIVDLPEAEIYEAVHFDALPLLDRAAEPEIKEDEAPEADESNPALSKLGEIYQLGRHRLMCGDSTNSDRIAELMAKKDARLVFSDPPYDFDSTGGGIYSGKTDHNLEIKAQGIDKFDPFTLVIDANITNVFFCNRTLIPEYLRVAESLKTNWDIAVYHKLGGIPNTNGHLMTDIEYIMIIGKQAPITGQGDTELYSKVFTGEKDRDNEVAWSKPISLCSKFLKLYTKNSEVVVDYFGGSGSTLIACEQLDRTCYMMELDPTYCDVIRKRYHKFVNDGKEDGWAAGTPAVERALSVSNG